MHPRLHSSTVAVENLHNTLQCRNHNTTTSASQALRPPAYAFFGGFLAKAKPFSICVLSSGNMASIAAFSKSFIELSPLTLATPSGPSCTRLEKNGHPGTTCR
eukprot:GHUV01022991.1.p4 GENE.GHUV01022991.1~~GHUV01022991.1.p4  ORF type:complete len:103 (-),score=14.35 GHUV01022991.1:344-652(-)